jgi:hypothetical protein
MKCIQYILAADLIMIATSAVIGISYEQDVHRRLAAAIGVATVGLGTGY